MSPLRGWSELRFSPLIHYSSLIQAPLIRQSFSIQAALIRQNFSIRALLIRRGSFMLAMTQIVIATSISSWQVPERGSNWAGLCRLASNQVGFGTD
jgi:hypothetical protein